MATLIAVEYPCAFDFHSQYWVKDAEYNTLFLRTTQNYLNDVLNIKGYLFLNDILERLGLDKIRDGQVSGILRDELGFVDLGIERDLTTRSDFKLAIRTNGDILDRVEF